MTMKIDSKHWLEDVQRESIEGGNLMRTRRFLVIHNTAGATGMSSIEYWKSQGGAVCAHFVIERDGTIIQCRPCNRTAGHAGKSRWQGFIGLNSCSIGIELANAGFDTPGRDAFDWASRQPQFQSRMARHKHGGPTVEWEMYPQAQLDACTKLAKALKERYNLDDIIGHEDCSKGRKVDPGPVFPMQKLRRDCGIDNSPLL